MKITYVVVHLMMVGMRRGWTEEKKEDSDTKNRLWAKRSRYEVHKEECLWRNRFSQRISTEKKGRHMILPHRD